jgi:hypothetical protein
LSRLNGFVVHRSPVVAADWDVRTPWMELMEDVRDHYALKLYGSVIFRWPNTDAEQSKQGRGSGICRANNIYDVDR